MRLLISFLLAGTTLGCLFAAQLATCAGTNVSGSSWSRWIYDDTYMTRYLDSRFPYLKRANGTYLGLRNYFNFTPQFQPTPDYLSQLNIEQYLHNEFKAIEITSTRHHGSLDIWHYSDAAELRRSGGPSANWHQCQEDLAHLGEEIQLAALNSSRLFERGHRNMQLLRWIDSWGRPVSETYYGNSYWVGSYRGCKLARIDETQGANGVGGGRPIEFRYCWSKLRARDWPLRDELRPEISIRAGVCLPKSCDTLMANTRANKRTIHKLLTFNFSPMHRERFNKLTEIYCLPDQQHQHQLPLATRLFLGLTSVWLTCIAIASLIVASCRNKPQARAKIPTAIKCLCLQVNLSRLLAENKPPAGLAIDLRILDLAKFLGSLAMCIAHTYTEIYMAQRASSFLLLDDNEKWIHRLPISITAKALDLFLVLSGLLGSFVILSRFASRPSSANGGGGGSGGRKIHDLLQPQNYIGLNLARYLRLAPTLMFAIAFVKSTQVYLAEGPFWDYGTSAHSQQGVCHQLSWWRVLLWPLVFDWSAGGSKFSPYHVECFPPSWFIITEMKIFAIVPLYVYLLYTKRQWRLKMTASAVLASTLCQFKDLRLQQVIHASQVPSYGWVRANMMPIKFTESSYFNPINKFHATAVGLWAGVYLFENKIRPANQWRPRWIQSNWTLAAVICWHAWDLLLAPLWIDYQYRVAGSVPGGELGQQLMVILKPRADAITIAIVLLRCVSSSWAPTIMQMAGSTARKLSKLSYSIYCIHPIIYTYFMFATEHSRPYSGQPPEGFVLGHFLVTFSMLMAVPLFLLVESPLELLLNHLGDRDKFRDKMHRLEWANLNAGGLPTDATAGNNTGHNGKLKKV